MANPQAGWYPDPAGNPTLIRYWDGMQWTDQFREVEPSVISAAYGNAAATGQQASATRSDDSQQQAYAEQSQGQPAQSAGSSGQQSASGFVPLNNLVGSSAATSSEGNTTSQESGSTRYESAYATQAPTYGNPAYAGPAYQMAPSDRSLRAVAFAFNLVTTILFGVALIPLIWMIPMTVCSWKIYKGRKPNTVAFGVCTLLFLNFISGLLLLCSTKEE